MMDDVTFLKRVAEALDHDGSLTRGQALEELPAWDSLGVLSIVSLLEDLGVNVDTDAIAGVKTTDDLIALADSAVHD